MHLDILQITDPGLAYMVLGGFAVSFSMVSLLVKEKLYINEVILGTACGIIFGPYGFNTFNPRSWGGDLNMITLEVMRITLAAGLFAIGVELPKAYLFNRAKSLLVMVVPTMVFGWLVVAAFIFVLFPPLNFVSALVIAACLTPTDPIISAAIVDGNYANQHVPETLRHIISAESAANDGLAYPFLSISILLTLESSRSVAFGEWFFVGWLYQVILGTVFGAVLGFTFSRLLKLCMKHKFIDRQSFVAQYLALALFTVGFTHTIGSDDLLAAFAAGSAINWDGYFKMKTEDEIFPSVINLLLNCGCFIYIGAWMPFHMFNAPELGITPWHLIILFVAVLVLRRIPPLLLLYKWVPEIGSWREALFAGYFGPMGVSAIFVSTLAVTELPTPHSPPQGQAELLAATLQTIVSFVVLGSIIVHGLSIPFLFYGRRIMRTWTSRSHPLIDPVRTVTVANEDVEEARSKIELSAMPDFGSGLKTGQGSEESVTAVSEVTMGSEMDRVGHAAVTEERRVRWGEEGTVEASPDTAPTRPARSRLRLLPASASVRRCEQSSARSIRSPCFTATAEGGGLASEHRFPPGPQPPKPAYSSTQGLQAPEWSPASAPRISTEERERRSVAAARARTRNEAVASGGRRVPFSGPGVVRNCTGEKPVERAPTRDAGHGRSTLAGGLPGRIGSSADAVSQGQAPGSKSALE